MASQEIAWLLGSQRNARAFELKHRNPIMQLCTYHTTQRQEESVAVLVLWLHEPNYQPQSVFVHVRVCVHKCVGACLADRCISRP